MDATAPPYEFGKSGNSPQQNYQELYNAWYDANDPGNVVVPDLGHPVEMDMAHTGRLNPDGFPAPRMEIAADIVATGDDWLFWGDTAFDLELIVTGSLHHQGQTIHTGGVCVYNATSADGGSIRISGGGSVTGFDKTVAGDSYTIEIGAHTTVQAVNRTLQFAVAPDDGTPNYLRIEEGATLISTNEAGASMSDQDLEINGTFTAPVTLHGESLRHSAQL